MELKYILLGAILIILSISITVQGTPEITTYDNSVTGNDYTFPHKDINTNIQFNLTANESIVTWTWIKDGTTISNNWDNYTTSWTTKGYKNLTAYGTNANGTTAQIIWHPIIETQKSTGADVVATYDPEAYDIIIDAIQGDSPDFEPVLFAPTIPYTNLIGPVFFLILFGIPIIMIWIRTEKREIPLVLSFILGGLFLVFFPPEYVMTVVGLLLLAATGVLYSQFKERGA